MISWGWSGSVPSDLKGHFVILLGIGGDIGVVGAVFGHTHQLALGIKEAFDDQLGLVWVSAFRSERPLRDPARHRRRYRRGRRRLRPHPPVGPGHQRSLR